MVYRYPDSLCLPGLIVEGFFSGSAGHCEASQERQEARGEAHRLCPRTEAATCSGVYALWSLANGCVRRRQSGSQPWCLAAQAFFLPRVGCTTDVEEGVIYVSLLMRGAGRLGRMMCLDSVGMHNSCDSSMHLGTCRRLVKAPAILRAGSDPTNLVAVRQDQTTSCHGVHSRLKTIRG